MIAAAVALGVVSNARGATIFQINGGGDGHGIGMSQYGAYGYALRGETYQFILAHYYDGTALGTIDPNQVVRVLLAPGNPQFTGATAAGGHTLDPSLTYSVRALRSGALALVDPEGKSVGRFASPVTVTGPAPLGLVGQGQYRGALVFTAVGGSVQTVNAVDLEDYVRGVIAAEMPARWPLAALEAQAVVARTYAITAAVAGNGYELYSDTRSQVYGGVAAETPQTDAAVAATSGQIVTYDGNPATTYFFASSGGHTENIENVWLGAAPEPWLKGVRDPYDAAGGADPYHRWAVRMTLRQAQAKLGSLVNGRLRGIRVLRRGVSPRVISAEVVGTRGATSVTGPQLQSLFGLMSTYMRFTTISATRISRRTTPHLATQSWSLATLTGAVFPALRDGAVTIQVRSRRGWRTIQRVRVRAGGGYTAQVGDTGSYRVVYDEVIGPVITLG